MLVCVDNCSIEPPNLLCRHQFLTSLNLNRTSLGEEGVLSIANALKNGNSKLICLKISGNSMGNKSANAFGELFEFNHTLKDLDLSWNSIKVRPLASPTFDCELLRRMADCICNARLFKPKSLNCNFTIKQSIHGFHVIQNRRMGPNILPMDS